MARYSKQKNQVSDQTKADAMAIAKGTQKPGQTKEQTKLIAQGIQKGIEQYKKQQKTKVRELDKQLKKVKNIQATEQAVTQEPQVQPSSAQSTKLLPWVLLGLSWIGFSTYITLS